MSEASPSTPTTTTNDGTGEPGHSQARSDTSARTRSTTRRDNRTNGVVSSTHRDFAGDTPGIGGVLALRSENVVLKKSYDKFCEKLKTYIMREFKNGEHVIDLIKNPEAKVTADYEKTYKPTDLTDDEKKSNVEVEIKKEEIKEYVKQLNNLKANLKKMFSLVYGNCTEGVLAMLKGDKEFDEKSKVFDAAWILVKVKAITSGLDTKVNLRVSLHTALMNFMLMKQFGDESNDAYLSRFKSMVETLKLAGGEHVLISPKLLGKDVHVATQDERKEEKEHFMAICFIVRSDEGRYKKLLDDLKSSANRGRDEYPTTLTNAFDLLVRESGEYDTVRRNPRFNRGRYNRGGRGRDSFLFAQAGRGSGENMSYSRTNSENSEEIVPGTDGEKHENISCYGCGFKGHYRGQCPYVSRSGIVSMHNGYSFAQDDALFIIPDTWIFLDTCSTCDVIKNHNLVTNIRECSQAEKLTAYTNGGAQHYVKVADLIVFPIRVHFNENSMANILSFKTVANMEGTRITMDTRSGNSIHVFLSDGTKYEFKQYKNGLYYFDTNDKIKSIGKNKDSVINYSFLNTVQDNKEYFTNSEIKSADASRKYQEYLFFPSTKTLSKYVEKNMITNCGINVDDVNRGELIYGPPVPYVQGHMVRSKPQIHEKVEKIPLPLMIEQHHSRVSIAIDFFFVNGNIFFHTKSYKINFTTAQYCTSRSLKTIMTALDKVKNKYESRNFQITDCHADNEFDKSAMRDFLEPALLHIYARNEHVGIIERPTRTIKERTRSVCHNIPYRRITILMVRSLIEGIVDVMNAFPSEDGVSKTMSPSTIVEGKPKLDFGKGIISFGSYALVYTSTSNDMKSRAVPAIALKRSNNAGGHYFMSLYSGKRIHGYKWKELPVDDYVIARVEELAEGEKQPLIRNGMPIFEWGPGEPVEDVTHDEEEEVLAIAPQVEVFGDQRNEDVPSLENEEEHEVGIEDDDGIDDDVDNEIVIEPEDGLDVVPEENIVSDEDDIVEPEEEHTDEDDDNNGEASDDDVAIVANIDDNVEENAIRNRPRRANAGAGVERLQMDTHGQGYNVRREFNLTNCGDHDNGANNKVEYTFLSTACEVLFTQMTTQPELKRYAQMSAKQGFKIFGQAAVAAMVKEFKQLDQGAVPGKPVVAPTDVNTLTPSEKKKALRAVNLIKEKREGKLKGRTCVNGSQQRRYLKPDESVASPTANFESLITTLLIDAYEERDIATYDVPGAYLHADIGKKEDGERTLMKLEGEFVDIMCDINPEHRKNVTLENGKKVLYLEILMAIYGCIESALRWYELYSKTLKDEGFTINPYDKCVANKEINGSQCTIVWYVDDNKISHRDTKVVDEVIDIMKGHFGDLTINRGDAHTFLGMNIKIRADRKIEIEMKDQLQETIDTFKNFDNCTMDEIVTSPAQKHLRDVNESCTRLDGKKADIFHSIVATLLWIMKRARPDIEVPVSFLCSRVSKSDEDDWKKLRRVLTYVQCTIDDVRVIGAESLSDVFTWIDAAYAVNPDMRSQTGGAMSMGVGIIHGRSGKQKLNVKSSTEAELVGVSEYLPYNIWLMMFMREQGYPVRNNVLYQDNKSTILMLKNGRNSCTGNSRHIDIRHFFVKDRVDKKEVKVEYCPSRSMLADFFTKPLQGVLFEKFRSVIMGYEPMSSIQSIDISDQGAC